MSDNKKPDQGHFGSDGEDYGNGCHSLGQYSLEDIRMFLECLLVVAAIAGFLAFQLISNAFFEEEEEEEEEDEQEEFERDVTWIAKQTPSMPVIDEEDEYMEDFEFEDFEDENQEELPNQMAKAENRAEDEIRTREGKGAACLIDLKTCTFVPDYKSRKDEVKCKLLYFFREPTFLVSLPVDSEEPTECECKSADEEDSKENEEDETGELEGESKKDPDSAEGSQP
ncbi:tumor rejection antigen P815A-like [Mesocricetus auratus]|uniref:Tumor rejection antigen P815A-like n=1 Tax=Mesocricetus auratus TaxID=10036 RepID=A0A1U7QQ08_MESAU|nr:tumor rejection antigen P815A-like [Mesocricetus auratus]